jgi:hypothetical protein
MNKFVLTTSLAGALLTAACQHTPVWEVSEQRSQALAETASEAPAMGTLDSDAVVAPQLPLTRVWLIPVSAVGALGDDDLDQRIIELLAALEQWRHVERVEVIGHTDSRGSDSYNQRLSVQRADHVAERLILVGIDEQLIVHTGAGEVQPVADNETVQGRADNRRVEIRVTGLGPWPEDVELAFLPGC